MALVVGFTDTGMMVCIPSFDIPPRQGILLPSLGKVPVNSAITGIVVEPYSIFKRLVTESMAMGTAVTPSTLLMPHQIAILDWSLGAL